MLEEQVPVSIVLFATRGVKFKIVSWAIVGIVFPFWVMVPVVVKVPLIVCPPAVVIRLVVLRLIVLLVFIKEFEKSNYFV